MQCCITCCRDVGAASSVFIHVHVPPCHTSQLASPRPVILRSIVPQTFCWLGASLPTTSPSDPTPSPARHRALMQAPDAGAGPVSFLTPLGASQSTHPAALQPVAVRLDVMPSSWPMGPRALSGTLRLALTTSNSGYQTSSCGYCKQDDTSQRTPNSRALSPHDGCTPSQPAHSLFLGVHVGQGHVLGSLPSPVSTP